MSNDVNKLLLQGIKNKAKEHAAKDKDKLGILRGGSVGALFIKDGAPLVIGECHRKAHLRAHSISAPIEPGRHPMLQSGLKNEDTIAELIEAASIPGLAFRREEEIPVNYTLANGVRVTGRPDIVLGAEGDKGAFIPTRVLELKKTASVYGLRNHLLEGPDSKHLIQAGHYMFALGMGASPGGTPSEEAKLTMTGKPLPGSLIYTVDSDWHIPQMDAGKLGFLNETLADRNHRGGIKKVKSHYQVFDLEWEERGGVYTLVVHDTMLNKTLPTSLTIDSILRYYEAVSNMGVNGNTSLGPRPSSASLLGGEPSYRPCDYCDFKAVCDNSESNYERWKDEAVALVNNKKKEYGYD